MIGRLLERPRPVAHAPDDDFWYEPFGSGAPTRAGTIVNEQKAMSLSAMFRALDWLAGHLAMLPLPVFRRMEGDDRERVPEHPVTRLLNVAPNEDMTALTFRRSLHLHAQLWGTGRAEVLRDGAKVQSLNLLSPMSTTTKREIDTRELYHEVRENDGPIRKCYDSDVVRVPAIGADGVIGYGLVQQVARENIGLALAIEQYASAFFGNNTALNVILSAPNPLRKEARAELRKSWNDGHKGPGKAFKVAVMDCGVKAEKFGQENEAAQLIESKTFSVQDVARWTGMPPPLLMELSRATFSNIAVQDLWYVKYTLTPWFKAYEQEFTRKLLSRSERISMYVEFVPEGFLRGDIETRYNAYEKGLRNGFLNRNEVRRMENMNSMGPQGDIYTIEQNMATVERVAEGPGEFEALPAPSPGEDEEAKAARLIAMDVGTTALKPPSVTDDMNANCMPGTACDIRNRIADAHKPLLADTLSRMVRVEATAAKRAEKKGVPLAEWADDFYSGDYAMKLRAALIVPFEALAGAVRATLPPVMLDSEWDVFVAMRTRALVESCVGMSRAEVLDTRDGLSDDREKLASVAVVTFVADAVKAYGGCHG